MATKKSDKTLALHVVENKEQDTFEYGVKHNGAFIVLASLPTGYVEGKIADAKPEKSGEE